MVKYVPTYTKGTLYKKKRSAEDFSNNTYAMFCIFFSDFLYKSICSGYSLHQQVDAMGTHNICLYKEVAVLQLALYKEAGAGLGGSVGCAV